MEIESTSFRLRIDVIFVETTWNRHRIDPPFLTGQGIELESESAALDPEQKERKSPQNVKGLKVKIKIITKQVTHTKENIDDIRLR